MPKSHVYAGRSPDHGSAHLYSLGGLGILGAQVPTTGDDGRGGLLANDVAANGWQGDELRVFIENSTFPFLFVYDDSSYIASGLQDEIYSATQKVYRNGVLEGTAVLELLIGEFTFTSTITMVETGDDIVAMSAFVATPTGGTVDASISAVESGDDIPGMSVQIAGGGSQIPGADPYPIIVWPDNSLGGSSVERRYKQPSEVMDFDFDFSRWFARRTDEPQSKDVVVDAGLTVLNSWILGDRIKVMVSGGTNRAKYKVTVKMATTSGAVEEAECFVVIKET
jgi:hypothetical protein